MSGGIIRCGMSHLPFLVSAQCQLSVTGVSAIGQSISRQSGNNSFSAFGSTTAPDRICAPISDPFSRTTTSSSSLICFNLIAADRPAEPPPTITTSQGIDSRSIASALMKFSSFGNRCSTSRKALIATPSKVKTRNCEYGQSRHADCARF